MELKKSSFEAYGATIAFFHHAPERPKGVVVVVHGFGGHSGRYVQSVVPTLLESDLAVVLYDNIGHGLSGGKRGHCPSYAALLHILERVLDKAIDLYPDVPVYLYGHSMGGNLVLNLALRKAPKITGIIATSPYLRLAFAPPKWKMGLGKLLLRLWPSLTLSSGLDPNGISSIASEVQRYSNDPLVHDKVSPMYSFPIMEAGIWAIANAHKLKVPTLLLHGKEDPIIDATATQAFHEGAQLTELHLLDGLHELHHDRSSKEMLALVKKWLTERNVNLTQGEANSK